MPLNFPHFDLSQQPIYFNLNAVGEILSGSHLAVDLADFPHGANAVPSGSDAEHLPVKQSIFNLFHQDDRPQLQGFLAQRLNHPDVPISGQFHLLDPKGNSHVVKVKAELLHTPHAASTILLICQTVEKPAPSMPFIHAPELETRQMAAAVHQQAEREHLMRVVIQTIRNSLDLTTIFSTATREIAYFSQADRAEIFQYLPDRNVWLNVADYRQNPKLPSVLELELPDESHIHAASGKQRRTLRGTDYSDLSDRVLGDRPTCDRINQGLNTLAPGHWLVVPLLIGSSVWGCLALVRTHQRLHWQELEREICYTLADQLAIAIQQSQLYNQVRRLNSTLERQVQTRTAQLQLAFEFEETLKRITDKLRDSLDEGQILQTAIKELALATGVSCCNAALYDLEHRTSSIRYEYTTSPGLAKRHQIVAMADFPDGYVQLLQGQQFQFCPLAPNFQREALAVLACSISDGQMVLGDLWLFNQNYHCFSEQDLRLSQQVANYCAIALRQSRLYQASQAQVSELEKLNRLKDDFLSIVSHELRTPMTNIKMAAQMLDMLVHQDSCALNIPKDHGAGLTLSSASFQKMSRYLQILQNECHREIQLINDLLDLSRLDEGSVPLDLTPINLQQFLSRLAEPFLSRTQEHHQRLQIDIPEHLPAFVSEEVSLERIVTELLHNACKYTPANETIILRARFQVSDTDYGVRECVHRDPCLAALDCHSSTPTLSECGTIRLSVLNSGAHILPTDLAHIFDKFYRIPNGDPWKHGGTGLGLALVKKLTEHLNGTIHACSSSNQICFTVKLPTQMLPIQPQ
jgi:signal transduction histidine kinase